MKKYYYFSICERGHCIDEQLENPICIDPFCTECGSKVIYTCPSCGEPIRGTEVGISYSYRLSAPKFCHCCGSPYPWTALDIAAYKAAIEEADTVIDVDKANLIEHIPDIISETPTSHLVVIWLKKIIYNCKPEVKSLILKLVSDIACASVKNGLGL